MNFKSLCVPFCWNKCQLKAALPAQWFSTHTVSHKPHLVFQFSLQFQINSFHFRFNLYTCVFRSLSGQGAVSFPQTCVLWVIRLSFFSVPLMVFLHDAILTRPPRPACSTPSTAQYGNHRAHRSRAGKLSEGVNDFSMKLFKCMATEDSEISSE